MQQFRLLQTFPLAAMDVTDMHAEHVVDAEEEEEEGVTRGGGGDLVGGYRQQGKGKDDAVVTDPLYDYCNDMIEG